MKHGINTEEEAASAYADSGECNVFPAGIVINLSCAHLTASPDRRVYDPSKTDPWGLLEIKCPIKDSISLLKYLECVNGVYKLKKNTQLLISDHGADDVNRLPMGWFLRLL